MAVAKHLADKSAFEQQRHSDAADGFLRALAVEGALYMTEIVAIFDADPAKIGLTLGGHAVLAISELPDIARRLGIRHAMLAVPAEHAQAVADLVVAAGVTAILNYAPIHLAVPGRVRVQYIDPVLHLQQMTYYL